ncbi:MAG: TlpA family protein disulfide reductase [Acidobacteria bacterium]|nr:TlpA family protein disulfide reductase [Acidobacteriota bacterium]
MRIGDEIPKFEGATAWLNGTQEIADAFSKEGSPTLVHFWAVSCGICKDKMPKLNELKLKYAANGLKTVAIHMPRYEADSDENGVLEAVSANGLLEVCAIDNAHKLKDAFKNEQGWVPVYYLFDAEGKLKSRAAGEFGVGILKTALEKMFPETKEAAA